MNASEPVFWIMITSVITAFSFFVLAISMIWIALSVRKVVGTVNRLEQSAQPLIQRTTLLTNQGKEIMKQGQEIAEQLSIMTSHLSTATAHLSESAGLIKEEVAELKSLVSETAVTAKHKVALISQTIDDTNLQVRSTTHYIQTKVVDPARELAAVLAGVRRGLEVLFAPTPRPINESYNDEEWFIG